MAETKATINLPAGWTLETFNAKWAQFQKQTITNGIKSKARSKAVGDLIDAHKAEFDGYYAKYLAVKPA
jgi:hypothetical protein